MGRRLHDDEIVDPVCFNGRWFIAIDDLEELRSRRGESQHRRGTNASYRQEGELAILGHLITVAHRAERELNESSSNPVIVSP